MMRARSERRVREIWVHDIQELHPCLAPSDCGNRIAAMGQNRFFYSVMHLDMLSNGVCIASRYNKVMTRYAKYCFGADAEYSAKAVYLIISYFQGNVLFAGLTTVCVKLQAGTKQAEHVKTLV